MSNQSKFRVCQDRCPEDYGYPEVHSKIVERIESDPHKLYVAARCLGICTMSGGVNNRPEGGIGNFEEITEVSVRRGRFEFNEQGKISRKYLD
jgi:hypothetical protein